MKSRKNRRIVILMDEKLRTRYVLACKKLGYSSHTLPLHIKIQEIIQQAKK